MGRNQSQRLLQADHLIYGEGASIVGVSKAPRHRWVRGGMHDNQQYRLSVKMTSKQEYQILKTKYGFTQPRHELFARCIAEEVRVHPTEEEPRLPAPTADSFKHEY
jgi:hypothetical protein